MLAPSIKSIFSAYWKLLKSTIKGKPSISLSRLTGEGWGEGDNLERRQQATLTPPTLTLSLSQTWERGFFINPPSVFLNGISLRSRR
jgi:hypothetical protein